MNTPDLLLEAQSAMKVDPEETLNKLRKFFRNLRHMDRWQLLDAYNSVKFMAASISPGSVTYQQVMEIIKSIQRIAKDKPPEIQAKYRAILEDA